MCSFLCLSAYARVWEGNHAWVPLPLLTNYATFHGSRVVKTVGRLRCSWNKKGNKSENCKRRKHPSQDFVFCLFFFFMIIEYNFSFNWMCFILSFCWTKSGYLLGRIWDLYKMVGGKIIADNYQRAFVYRNATCWLPSTSDFESRVSHRKLFARVLGISEKEWSVLHGRLIRLGGLITSQKIKSKKKKPRRKIILHIFMFMQSERST